jgi:hypothetical protein
MNVESTKSIFARPRKDERFFLEVDPGSRSSAMIVAALKHNKLSDTTIKVECADSKTRFFFEPGIPFLKSLECVQKSNSWLNFAIWNMQPGSRACKYANFGTYALEEAAEFIEVLRGHSP